MNNKLLQFGKRVKQHRLNASMTQVKLAAKINCDVRTIQNIKAGTTNVTLEKIYALSDALNIKVWELFKV